MALKIFLDSDVVISSLISSSGAAYLLINHIKNLELYISNLSLKELEVVVERLKIDKNLLTELVNNRFQKVALKDANEKIKHQYKDYVLDIDDAHIVAGAKEAQVRFLISYNLRHYKLDKIKEDFGIIVLTPAQFLQYLRSQ